MVQAMVAGALEYLHYMIFDVLWYHSPEIGQ